MKRTTAIIPQFYYFSARYLPNFIWLTTVKYFELKK